MARSDRECPVCLLVGTWRGCRASMIRFTIWDRLRAALMFIRRYSLPRMWSLPESASSYLCVFSPLILKRTILTSRRQAARDVHASRGTLINIFERMENFFQRLDVYTDVAPTKEMMDILSKIMVEVLNILAIATKEIKQGRTSGSFTYEFIVALLSSLQKHF